jgi:hypothetical protein
MALFIQENDSAVHREDKRGDFSIVSRVGFVLGSRGAVSKTMEA